ncbi:hypothetical protein AQUCO_11400012v1 [Aquilegia coerulea]|uniref:Inositol polyphosphate-related phosphatase domain-containing protein n=1 Tax=Aquilegia coerulea TaxID=218851 RepID=A0A2G5C2D4_AQUCA|nr:hypothetical protein AQUCO_11400012v1 [Aquilegia coerulea]
MKHPHPIRQQPERNWLEICCCLQHFWPRVVLRKWLNIANTDSDYSADADEGDTGYDSEDNNEEEGGWVQRSRFGGKQGDGDPVDQPNYDEIPSEPLRRARRRNSETFRAQYINTKELRISVGTWNVGGKRPPDDLEIGDWLDVDDPADIYVLGFQEVVPLNVGNVLGAEDSGPVPKWEAIIRETLNRVQPQKAKYKCYSDPPSPSKFNPLDDIPDIEDELIISDSEGDDEVHPLDQTDSCGYAEVHPLDEEYSHFDEFKSGPDASEIQFLDKRDTNFAEYEDIYTSKVQRFKRQSSVEKKVNKVNNQMEGCRENPKSSVTKLKSKLTRARSGSERICLSWPEPPLDLLAQHVLERPKSFRSVKSFRASKSFRTSNSFKPCPNVDLLTSDIALLAELDLESIINRKRRSPFVRIASKQMVGVFISIWVRRSLRKHIRNLKVSTVGVGVMGYIGNKGSVSVSMSIYQTLFCFICTHLTSGEKQGDELRRNADVKEILRRTQFHPSSNIPFPKTIHAHEIIWFGDLNYRINLPYEKTCELISKKEWSKLAEKDQLIRELKKGRAFDGWTEGVLNFPPTYKYEFNSDKYCGEDPKSGRRNPAWCDRILSFGKGMRLVSYKRVEQLLSDHRPVKARYMADVEIFCHKKLKKALALTDAELEAEAKALRNLETNIEISFPRSGKEIFLIKDLMMADLCL